MAHIEQNTFCCIVKALFPRHFIGKKVLDIGSQDVNGCNRPLFNFCDYTGLDLAAGKNVDIVCQGHVWGAPNDYYDTIISTECGEHDEHWEKTIQNAMRMLKPGGLFIYTCATEGRPEHGTKRTDTFSSPFTTDYYRNLTVADIAGIPGFADTWQYGRFTIDDRCHDLRFFGIKKGAKLKFRPSVTWLIAAKLYFFFDMRRRDIKTGLLKMPAAVVNRYQKTRNI